jgi:hypothetical protein
MVFADNQSHLALNRTRNTVEPARIRDAKFGYKSRP